MENQKKQFAEYDLSDFLDDDSFVSWVKNPDDPALQFWFDVQRALPSKRETIENAKQVIWALSRPKTINTEKSRLKIWNRINPATAVDNIVTELPNVTTKTRMKLWPAIMGIAAMLTLYFSVTYFFFNDSKTKDQALAFSIQPGKIGATLTLANGKTILLSEAAKGKLAEQSGYAISKTNQGELIYAQTGDQVTEGDATGENKLVTANGQTYSLVLPDQSKVWLNASSSITYSPALVKNGKRKVILEGEAYFEITKNAKLPFIVECRNQTIEVLGTHFNVNAYADEPFTTTSLLEGSVRLTTDKSTKTLLPGQEGRSKSNYITVHDADVENAIDWKGGDFYLNHISFKTAMRKIARWYNVNIIYEATVPDDMESGGWISRDRSLSAVLKSIESAGLAKFRVEGRTIYVTE